MPVETTSAEWCDMHDSNSHQNPTDQVAAALWPGTNEAIVWATGWKRSEGLHGDDGYGFVAVTEQSVHFLQSNNSENARVQRALRNSDPFAFEDLARLVRGKGKTMSIARSQITEISALAALGVVQIQTSTSTTAIGDFGHRSMATDLAEWLSQRVLPGAVPAVRPKPALSGALVRQASTVPAAGAFFAAVVVALKFLLVWDTPNTRNQRGEAMMRAILDPVSPVVVIVLAIAVVVGMAALAASRMRNEQFWRLPAAH